MRAFQVRPFLVSALIACGAALVSACGGGGASVKATPPTPGPPAGPPVTGPATAGATLAAPGWSGGTFGFSFGPGAPAGETVTLIPLGAPAPPQPCSVPCPAIVPLQPLDTLAITVGPASLPLSAITGIALTAFAPSRDGAGYSLQLADQTVDEGTTVFNTSPAGGPLTEVHAFPDEGNPITALQPGRRYLLSLWPSQSQPKPDGSFFVPTNGTVQGTVPDTGDTVVIAFNGPVPAKEWLLFNTRSPLSGIGPATFVPPNFYASSIDAVLIDIGPSPIPVTSIAGVALISARTPSASRLEAGIAPYTVPQPAQSASLPFALAAPGTTSLPPNLQFTTGPDFGSSLSQLSTGAYVISIRSY
jgi:hypothetical protein